MDRSLQHHFKDRLTEIKVLFQHTLVGRFYIIKKIFLFLYVFMTLDSAPRWLLSSTVFLWSCYIQKIAEINQNKYSFNWLVTSKRNTNTPPFLRCFVNYFLQPGGRNTTPSAAIKFKRLWIWALIQSLAWALCPTYSLKTLCQTNAALQKHPHKFPYCNFEQI